MTCEHCERQGHWIAHIDSGESIRLCGDHLPHYLGTFNTPIEYDPLDSWSDPEVTDVIAEPVRLSFYDIEYMVVALYYAIFLYYWMK